MTENFQAITQFIVEIEQLKSVERKIKPVGLSRYENSAEHNISVAQILRKNVAIEKANPRLWQWIQQQVIEKGEQMGLRKE